MIKSGAEAAMKQAEQLTNIPPPPAAMGGDTAGMFLFCFKYSICKKA
jgi:hypothetical protein